MLPATQEVIVGVTTDPSFGKLVAFGLGGVLVEVLQDITFRLAPATHQEAVSMLDDIAGAAVLRGVRGAAGVNREALGALIENVSHLAHDFPEISEMDLNPVFASSTEATAVDVRIVVDFTPPPQRYRPSQEEILRAMRRIMQPNAVAVIGASPEDGKIGNSVMKNLINGGYEGAIYPIHPRAEAILEEVLQERAGCARRDRHCHLLHPGTLRRPGFGRGGKKRSPGRFDPFGFAEIGEEALQQEVVNVAREYNIRLMGPEYLRLLLHAQEPLRDLLYTV